MTKANNWIKLSSKTLLNHKNINIHEDKVLLPNNKESTYIRDAPTNIHSVIMIAVNDKDEVLVQKEYSYPPNEILWQLPGGSMKEKEDIETSALRELSEESGYSASKTKVLGYYYTQNRRSNQKQFVVLCTDLYPNKLTEDEDEFIESYWLTRTKIIENIKSNTFKNINLLAALNIWFYNK